MTCNVCRKLRPPSIGKYNIFGFIHSMGRSLFISAIYQISDKEIKALTIPICTWYNFETILNYKRKIKEKNGPSF